MRREDGFAALGRNGQMILVSPARRVVVTVLSMTETTPRQLHDAVEETILSKL